MLASTNFRLTNSANVRGALLWILTALVVFWVLDGLATRPKPVHVEEFRQVGMNDEQVLSLALQAAKASEHNGWWINDRTSYLVFDTSRTYAISEATYAAFDLKITRDAMENPIAIVNPNLAGMRKP